MVPYPALRQRQVHLDFHTPGNIERVGEDFDPAEFAETIQRAHINSITVFSRCHHGYSYHPTSLGTMHPGLSFDLLGSQIDALHKVDVRAPIYLTVGWDELIADLHPEWLQVDASGQVSRTRPHDASSWRFLDLASPYVDYVMALTEEVLSRYAPVDGIFFDIVRQDRNGMSSSWRQPAQHMPEAAGSRQSGGESLDVERRFLERASHLVRSANPHATVFFNSRLRPDRVPELGSRAELPWYSHIEIESLPGGEWGYNHYPLFAGYFQSLGYPLLGMTGAFHTSWGDFGSVKSQAALDYECSRMAATGAACSIGDHLHPSGKLDRAIYRSIGATYSRIEAIGPWCSNALPLADIGVMLAETGPRFNVTGRESDEGAMRMLLEQHRQFHFIDSAADLSLYKVVIAPDSVPFDSGLAAKVKEYLDRGGTLLLTHRSGLTPEGDAFAPTLADEFGVDYVGDAPHCPDFLVAGDSLGEELQSFHQVLYERGTEVRLRGAQTLARMGVPYFSRSPDNFYGHRQSPFKDVSGHPSITRNNNVIYCHSPLFEAYRRHAVPAYRDIVAALLDQLLDTRLVQTDGLPSTAEVYALRQPQDRDRVVVHIIHAVPQRRSSDIDIVEDVLPLHEIRIGVRADVPVEKVSLVPSETVLPHETKEGVTWVTIPKVEGHQAVVFG